MNTTTPTRHRRHSSHPGFSHLLTTVLGSPFLTTADLPELVDGAPVFVPHNQTITRPSSPTPTVGSSSFSFIQFDPDNPNASSPNRPPLKSILPRIWDVLTPSRSLTLPPTTSPFSYGGNYGSFKGHAKPRYFDDDSRFIDYSELAPLDGEEGELIAIDDEACFFIDPAFGSRAVTGIDILALLPTELALYILITLCTITSPPTEALHTLLACAAVSRTWSTLAGDNTVWRALFLARWNVDLTRRSRRRHKLPPAIVPTASSSLPSFGSAEPQWRLPLSAPTPVPITPTKADKPRAGMGVGMAIKRRKAKKLLASSSSNGTTISSSSSSPSSSSRTILPRRFFTPPRDSSGRGLYRFPCPSSPSPTPTRVPAPAPIQHPRISSAPGELDRYSISVSSQAKDKDLASAPLQIDWNALYRTRLELERRWLGTAVEHLQADVSPRQVLSPSPRPLAVYQGHQYPHEQQEGSVHVPPNLFLPRPSSSQPGSSSGAIPSPQNQYQTPHHRLSPSPSASQTPAQFAPRIERISGHTDSVYCLEFDSRRIVTGSRDRTIKVWSLRDGRLLGSFGAGVGSESASGSNMGTGVGVGVGGGGGGEEEKVRGHTGSVLCLKFSADWDAGDEDEEDGERGGRERKRGFMVSGSSDCSVCVWDLWTGAWLEEGERMEGQREREVKGEVRAVLRGHAGGVLDLRIDGRWIVSCSKDAVIRVWDRETLALARTLRGHEGPVNAVGLQNGRVVSASGDGKMILWDINSGERIRTFEGHDRGLACIEFKDELIVSGSNDCKIKVWSATTGECIRTLVGHEALVRALAFDPKSGRLVSASYDKTVKVWDLASGKLVREFKNTHTSHIFDVKFDASRIVSTSHDQKIVVIDFSEGLDTSLFV
ncbi:putative WD40 repeat-like protein [Lyophyllum shimeji]|uniref:WD40 repeat-like protein n=1 Tax=Lyophyllum shimeji TaxID=47721 RepID=A0A9P3PPZ6_LYOSH|nr:putative WD40 repeat-like protein [Lyophyllum shimeji]